MAKKIVFIETKPPNWHLFSRTPLPRLGTIILGTKLKAEGYDVKIYVEEIAEMDLKEVLSADVIGISSITSTSQRSYEIAKLLRSAGKTVIMGGPHVTYMPEEAIEHCDYVVRGEADDTILDIIPAVLNGGKGIEKIPGMTYRNADGDILHNKTPAFCKDMDTIPIPDYSLVKGLETDGIKNLPITPLTTSRGCPYDCHFCSVTSMFGRKYRFRSEELVIEELRLIKEQGSNWIFFYDDNFIADRGRTKKLLQSMIDQGVTPNWTAQVRVEVAKDPELMDLMKRSGCHTVYVGFESINPATLEAYNKSQSLEDIEHCIETMHDYGIRIHGMFVFGSDEDTVQTIRETQHFATKNKIESVQFLMLTPLPGTKLYYDLDREERIVTKDWALYDAHHAVYTPKLMNYYQLQTETMDATRNFYTLRAVVSEGIMKFNMFNIVIKLYGYRLSRNWYKTHKHFVEYTKELSENAGRNILAAKKTAEDIKEKFHQLELSGDITMADSNRTN